MSFRFRALVEDRAHEHLLRGLVERLRLDPERSISWEAYRQNKGAAEKRVRDAFPGFVKALRSNRDQQGLWGIVVIDGDLDGFDKRRRQLLSLLEQPLTTSDRVLLFVPTRNVETWAYCLLGHPVDEDQDFKQLVTDPLRPLFRDRWEPPQSAEPQSLVAARAEWKRLPR
jgi:hypothetical protein